MLPPAEDENTHIFLLFVHIICLVSHLFHLDLHEPFPCFHITNILSLSTCAVAGATLPISVDLANLLVADFQSDDQGRSQRALDNLHYHLVVLADSSAASTMTTYSSSFRKWASYAERSGIPVAPPVPCTDLFMAHFDRFVLEIFQEMETKSYKNGRKQSCTPKSFSAVFTAVNSVFDKVFLAQRMESRVLTQARRAFTRRNSRPPRKARPVLPHHIKMLCDLSDSAASPWITLVKNVIVIMLMGAGRWACVDAMDVEKTHHHAKTPCLPENPGLTHSLLFWKNRKTRDALSFTTIPTLRDKRMDARSCFLDILSTHDRPITSHSHLIPLCHKRGTEWFVDPDPQKYMGYRAFLDMFKETMRRAGCGSVIPASAEGPEQDFTLHGPRRGFVKLARDDKTKVPLLYEVVGIQGGWAPTSVSVMMGYNDIDPSRHAEIIRALYETESSTEESGPARKRMRPTRFYCKWRFSENLTLDAITLSPIDDSTVKIQAGAITRVVPTTSLRVLGPILN